MIGLRKYQTECVSSILHEWTEHDSTLAVLATGTGKTQIFCEIIKRCFPKRALVLAHREELIYQAVARLSSFGIQSEIEMADFRAAASFWNRMPCVVSTVQTQVAGNNGKGRMARFDPMDFGLVICDEAHHFVSPQNRRVLDYYRQNKELKILGVTATPDRADELALGQIFQSVAFDYEILDAIREGYLVPIEQRVITLESLDFSQMATTAGDLNGADLAAEMEKEKILYGVADATMKEVGERRTVIFTVSVKQAEALCGILNGYRRDCAAWICGKTAKDRRAAALKKFSNGEIQIMVNCGVLLEGYNEVGIQHVVMARPTKSRCLYSQAIGRGTRPLAGVIDGIETDEGRRAAIAASDKPALVVVDFAGNAGRHKLMTSADILGGNYSDEEVARTTEMLKKSAIPRNTAELLDEAKAEIAAENERRRLEAEAREKRDAERRGRIRATATYTVQIVNAFDSLDIVPTRSRGWDSGKVISEKMANLLRKHLGLDPSRVTYHEARQLLGELFRRWDNKLCTPKQGGILKRHGIDTKNLSMSDASALIDQLAKNNWKKPEGFGQPAQEKVFA